MTDPLASKDQNNCKYQFAITGAAIGFLYGARYVYQNHKDVEPQMLGEHFAQIGMCVTPVIMTTYLGGCSGWLIDALISSYTNPADELL